ncbi:hypothetical protein NPM06_33765, partial [Bacillus cereus]|uniref:hypothetical protein n=1 Tax=Bacillus cereus TaxID=1396 RepID=UPI002112B2A7|nr:hypothetical protein [Bacillus cereus]
MGAEPFSFTFSLLTLFDLPFKGAAHGLDEVGLLGAEVAPGRCVLAATGPAVGPGLGVVQGAGEGPVEVVGVAVVEGHG